MKKNSSTYRIFEHIRDVDISEQDIYDYDIDILNQHMATCIHVYITSLMLLDLTFRALPCFASYASMPCFITYSIKARIVKPSL